MAVTAKQLDMAAISPGQHCPKASRSLCHFSPLQEPCPAHFPSLSKRETNNRTWAKGQVQMGTLKSFCSYQSCLPECRWIWLLFTRYNLCRQIWHSCHTSARGGVRKVILPNVSRQRQIPLAEASSAQERNISATPSLSMSVVCLSLSHPSPPRYFINAEMGLTYFPEHLQINEGRGKAGESKGNRGKSICVVGSLLKCPGLSVYSALSDLR